jgi:hypothetical protein
MLECVQRKRIGWRRGSESKERDVLKTKEVVLESIALPERIPNLRDIVAQN